MSEAEALELIAAYTANLAVWLSIYLSITFAFLVVAHTAGSKLSRFQTTVISTIYTVASLISYASMLVTQLWMDSLIASNPITLRSQSLKFVVNMKFWEITLGVLVLSGVIVSLYYLHDIQKKGGVAANE